MTTNIWAGAVLVLVAAATRALEAGEVDTFSTEDIFLAGISQSEGLVLVGGQHTQEPYGVIIPMGQSDMVEFVDGVTNAMIEDGRWGTLYYEYLGGIPGLRPWTSPRKGWHGLPASERAAHRTCLGRPVTASVISRRDTWTSSRWYTRSGQSGASSRTRCRKRRSGA